MGSGPAVTTVANLKGGAGKTTTAFFLALAFARSRPTLLIDADPQGSAMQWARAAGEGVPFTTVAMPTASIHRDAGRLGEAFAAVVIDTPPGHPEIAVSALRAARLAIVPVQPAMLDAMRAPATLDAAAEARELGGDFDLRFLLVRTRARTRSLGFARDALREHGLPLFGSEIPQREDIAMAAANMAGGRRLRSLGAYDALADEIATLGTNGRSP